MVAIEKMAFSETARAAGAPVVFDTNDMNTLDMATQHSGEEDEGRMAALAAMLREQGARHSMMYMRWPNMTMADSALALQECFRGHQARSAVRRWIWKHCSSARLRRIIDPA